ncbi:MAG: DegT/DnrJ/EryC1/StrS family aminotransferase [Parvibaculales bacterium]
MHVPFNDLHQQYLGLKDEIDAAIAKTIENGTFVRGPEVDAFEESFAAMMEGEHCVSCANGTDALYIAMHALGVKQGDEVIVPAHSWISTSEAVTQAGGKVVFCDTRDTDFTIDNSQIEQLITDKTVGIIPVHLFGHPAQMDEIMKIAKKHALWVVEDCAQAHLATFNSQKVGSFGDMAIFSFYPGKNLGAMGDAGALVTSDAHLARRAARFARHGGLVKGSHEIEGINSRMDGLQAAILNVKLPHLPDWTKRRQELADIYKAKLADIPDIVLPAVADAVSHVWHLFVIRTEHRDALRAHLSDNDIQTVINYPTALPFLDAYSHFQHGPNDFPIAHHHQSRILSLPIYPDMSDAHIETVVCALGDFDEKAGKQP